AGARGPAASLLRRTGRRGQRVRGHGLRPQGLRQPRAGALRRRPRGRKRSFNAAPSFRLEEQSKTERSVERGARGDSEGETVIVSTHAHVLVASHGLNENAWCDAINGVTR